MKIHQSMWIHWPFFPKTWTKGHWPLDDLWPHVCWGHMCDSTQGSLCPSPMTIHQCMWIQWSILQITTYIHTHTTYILRTYYILHTTYRMSDHIVSYWTQFRRDKNISNEKIVYKHDKYERCWCHQKRIACNWWHQQNWFFVKNYRKCYTFFRLTLYSVISKQNLPICMDLILQIFTPYKICEIKPLAK